MVFKQVALAAERENASGWHHLPDFRYRSVNMHLATFLTRMGEVISPYRCEAATYLHSVLGGVPAQLRLISLPQLLEFPWTEGEAQTIFVTHDDLEAAQAGQLPDLWADQRCGECQIPVRVHIAPRDLAAGFVHAQLGHLRDLVDNQIPDYGHVRIVAALIP